MSLQQRKHMRNYSNIIGSPSASNDLRAKNHMAMPTAEFAMNSSMTQQHDPKIYGSDRKSMVNEIIRR